MGKPGRSATELGGEVGLTGQDFNVLLEARGFQTGGPGKYVPTEKGAKFFTHVDHDNGYGGYARRDWTNTYLDPSIRDELDLSPQTVAATKSIAKAAREAKRAERAADAQAYWAEFEAERAAEEAARQPVEIDPKKVLTILSAAVAVGLAIYITVKVAPRIKRGWDKRADPSPRRSRVAGEQSDADSQ